MLPSHYADVTLDICSESTTQRQWCSLKSSGMTNQNGRRCLMELNQQQEIEKLRAEMVREIENLRSELVRVNELREQLTKTVDKQTGAG
jgi:hypothetical protein